MAFAGGLGAQIELGELARQSGLADDAALLFSESNTRFLLEVAPDQADAFEAQFADLPLVRLGEVTDEERLVIRGHAGQTVIESGLHDLKAAWQAPLDWSASLATSQV